jgi:Flp pilus assembly pilin Flp
MKPVLSRSSRRGVSHIEYGLILLVGVFAGILGMDLMGQYVGEIWGETSTEVVRAVDDAHVRGGY